MSRGQLLHRDGVHLIEAKEMDMQVLKIVKGLVLLSLLVGAGVVHAQDRIQANPAQKLFTFKLADNSVIAADGVSRRFYLQTVNGGTLEMPLMR